MNHHLAPPMIRSPEVKGELVLCFRNIGVDMKKEGARTCGKEAKAEDPRARSTARRSEGRNAPRAEILGRLPGALPGATRQGGNFRIPLPTFEFPRLFHFGTVPLLATGVNQQQPPVPSTSNTHSSSSRQPTAPVDQQGAGSSRHSIRPHRAAAGDRQATTISFQMAEQNQSNVGVADQSRIIKAKCLHCKQNYAANTTRNGTSGVRQHLTNRCKVYKPPPVAPDIQKLLNIQSNSSSIETWKFEQENLHNVFTITVDNASSNDVAVLELSKKLDVWGTNMMEDGSIAGSIQYEDWANVRNITKFLEKIYELTLKVPGSHFALEELLGEEKGKIVNNEVNAYLKNLFVIYLARDVLTIPMSSVASECAFSTGDRILDPFRSSLTPKCVQCLICVQDWLRQETKPICVEESLEFLEKIELGPRVKTMKKGVKYQVLLVFW
ncbi:hypothetical protein KY285_019978 [Solanum tuberosum]|nr:hypothetical protein KY285_019978 [Solanum tuberosum]